MNLVGMVQVSALGLIRVLVQRQSSSVQVQMQVSQAMLQAVLQAVQFALLNMTPFEQRVLEDPTAPFFGFFYSAQPLFYVYFEGLDY